MITQQLLKKALYSGPYTVEDWNGTSGTFTLVKKQILLGC